MHISKIISGHDRPQEIVFLLIEVDLCGWLFITINVLKQTKTNNVTL